MANGTTTDPQEVEFRRRWYEAHAGRAARDSEYSHEWKERLRSAAPEAFAIRDQLATTGDLDRFVVDLRAWAAKPDVGGLMGNSGVMFVGQLVKRADDPGMLARLLVSGLTAPRDAGSAAQKLDALVEYIERIKVGAIPAPGHTPFLLSYFWSLEQPEQWPVYWIIDRNFLELLTGVELWGSHADRYLRYVNLIRDLDNDIHHFEAIAGWWHERKTAFLDPVLVDRCAYGVDPGSVSDECRHVNAAALVGIAGYLGHALIGDLSDAVGLELKVNKPSLYWVPSEKQPRSDLWVDWRVPNLGGIGLRLWVNDRGAAIGVSPEILRQGWTDEAREVIAAGEVDGFRMMRTQHGAQGDDMGFRGRMGSFIYGRWYERDQLADLDLRTEVVEVARAARPVLEALIRRAAGQPEVADIEVPPPPRGDPLVPVVEEFIRESGYPDAGDNEQRAHQPRLREMLGRENLATIARDELRSIWTRRQFGGTGPQSVLNRSLRDADEAEYERILRTIDYVCWGDADDADRIDKILDDPDYKVAGLGESVILKLLTICKLSRYVPVYPYSGPKGKLRMLKALGLDAPLPEASRGRKQVEANDLLRERVGPFFPDDPWGMMRFLYRYIDRGEAPQADEPDPLDQAAEELLVKRDFLDDIVDLLKDKGQVILYGPPGTGKTFLAQRLAEALAPESRRTLVQFHPSTSYEDFFEGYRPEEGQDGQIIYQLTPGPLARMAEHAAEHPGRHVMIIDEINRANLPKVLGELLFLFEYRKKSISTLYRPDDEFELPDSLWFIGTMNTADRSIALVDAALRRRFHFVPFFPDRGPIEGLIGRWLKREEEPAWVEELVAMVNHELTEALGADLQLGASHFMKKGYRPEPDADDPLLRRIWEYNIEPFIEDQLFGNQEEIERFRFGRVVKRYRGQFELDDHPSDPDQP